jgi:hypothetical protein
MSLSFADFVSMVKSNLTAEEATNGAAYAAETPVAAGARLRFPCTVNEVPAEAYLAFIDREPMANWSHAARYLIVGRPDAERQSFDARLPPFTSRHDLRWRVV